MFWEQVQDNKQQATLFLVEVLDRLLLMLDKPQQFGVGLETVVNTINFITLFLEIVPTDPRMKKIFEAWKKKEKETEFSRKYPPAKEVVRTLSLKSEKEDIVAPLLISCSTLHSVDEYQKLNDVAQFPTLDPNEARPGDGTFIYSYLKKLTTEDRARCAAILQNTVQKVSLPRFIHVMSQC